MNAKAASLLDQTHVVKDRSAVLRGTVATLLFFLTAYVFLFLGMIRSPRVFDEGIVVTSAMRVAANQIPHRDFYFLYGPAQLYLLAGLFRIFGQSLLVERLFDLFLKALVVAAVYAITSAYCRRSIAAGISLVALLWLIGLNQWPGSPTIPVSALNLISCALVVPLFAGPSSRGRMFAAGTIAGTAALFRYDTGIGLLAIHVCAITIAVFLRRRQIKNRLRAFASAFLPDLLGFALITVPPAMYYLSVAPLSALVHDVIRYPGKYYYRGRNLPFPAVGLHSLEFLGVYLPIVIAIVTLLFVVTHYLRSAPRLASGHQDTLEEQGWFGFLITFCLLTLAMYVKGLVRVSLPQMYLAIIPSLLLIAVLYQHRSSFPRLGRIAMNCLAAVSLLAAASLAFHQSKDLHLTHLSVPEYLFSGSSSTQMEWCQTPSPLTAGFCFLPDDDRVRTIEFIRTHTRPDQPIYVGLVEHQKIFAGDNILYFATQRLPATRWSELDPDLESRYDVQTQMVQELETNAAPYIVLDAEFEGMNEQNDSSRSSGVTLLDNYIRNKYEQVENFGIMSIWKRKYEPGAPS